MYNDDNLGKHYIPAHRRRKNRRRKRQSLIIAVVMILCSIIAGTTIAFLFTNTEHIKNIFTDAYVACDVQENFDGTVKSDVTIKNTGEVQSYIRAQVVVTWMSDDGLKVTASKPIDDTDYVIIYADETNTATNWEKGSDGYWYYKLPVDVGKETEKLVERCHLKEGVTVPEGFYLSVEIVASAIQSTPARAIMEQWNSGVSGVDDSTLIIR